MKRIFFFILLLVCFKVDAQVKQKPTTYGIQYRRLQADSGLRIPTVQIGTKDLYAGFDTAQLYYRKSDSALLTYTGSQWILARGAAGASTPTWQQTLTAGSTLTSNNIIELGVNTLNFRQSAQNYFKLYGNSVFSFLYNSGMQKSVEFQIDPALFYVNNHDTANNSETNFITDGSGIYSQSQKLDLSRYSELNVESTVIEINPDRGNLKIDTLTAAAGTKALRYSPVTGLVSYADTTISGTGSGDSLYYNSSPSQWLNQQSVNNPVIRPDMTSPAENTTYFPTPIPLKNGEVWVFTKGDLYNRIYGWKSIDNGETFSCEGVAIDQSSSGWDSSYVLDPYAHYDSLTDVIRLYYMGGRDYPYPNFGIGLATASGSDPMNFTKDAGNPILSNASFQAQMGIAYETGYLSVSSIVKKDGDFYFHGAWLNGNTGYNPNLRTRLWVGHSSSFSTISNIDSINIPLDSIQVGVKTPTVWKEGQAGYKMILSYGNPLVAGGKLKSAHSTDLINWTLDPGNIAVPVADTTWDGLEIYSAQLLKKGTGNYDEPVMIYQDSAYGYPFTDQTYGNYLLYFSGTHDTLSPLVNKTGLLKLYPQKSTMRYAVSDVGNDVNLLQRNTTAVINIPTADSLKTGKLSATDWNTFYNKAPASGSDNYINNTYTQEPNKYFNIGKSGLVGRKLTVGTGADSIYSLTVDSYNNPSAGATLILKNSNNFGINRATTVTTQIADLWTGTGIGYLQQQTSATYGFQDQFYRRAFGSVFYPFPNMMTWYGQGTDSTAIEMTSIRTPGNSVDHTDNGTTLHVIQQDAYNTTAAARTSYAGRFYNTASRASGANDLTNIGIDVRATGGQNNIALRTSSGDVQFWGLPSGVGTKALRIDAATGIIYMADTTAGGGYTDEQAQDAIGAMLNASLTYTDGTPLLTIADRDNGDITTTAAGLTWTIDNGVVSLAKMADMATASLIYRKTAGTGVPEVNTLATLKTDLGLTGTNTGDQSLANTSDATSHTVTLTGGTSVQLIEGSNITLTTGGTGGVGTLTISSSGGSGLTVGTTTITSGTDTRIPFNDAGVYNEDAGLTYNKTTDFLAVGGNGVFGGTAVQNAAGWNRAFTVRDASHAMINTYSSGTGIDLTMVSSNVGGYGGAVGGLFGTVSAHPLTIFTNSVQRLEIDASGHIVINESGVDANFRIESDTYTSAFYVEGTDGTIILQGLASGVTTPTPTGTEHMMTIDANGLVGHRTLPAGGTTYYNANVGSAYRWAIPNTNNIKTASAGVGILIDSATANQNDIAIAGYQAWANNTTTTSDATVTTLATIATPNDSRGILEVTLVGIETGDVTTGLTGKKFVHWKNVAGTVTVLQVIDEEADYRETFTTATWTVDASSGNLRVRVTGEAATSCTWNSVHKLKYQTYSL